jgi:hypothetical protein
LLRAGGWIASAVELPPAVERSGGENECQPDCVPDCALDAEDAPRTVPDICAGAGSGGVREGAVPEPGV